MEYASGASTVKSRGGCWMKNADNLSSVPVRIANQNTVNSESDQEVRFATRR
jgi:hypothetical protein